MNPISSGAFRALCDHAFWHNAEPRENPDFQTGQVIFCKIDEVWRLFRALRRTRSRIVLVTGEGDKPVSPALFLQKPPHVQHWFGMNMQVNATAGTPLPLGLGEKGQPATLDWAEIQSVAAKALPRRHLLYANFGTASNPSVRGPLKSWLEAPDQSWITQESHTGENRASYLLSLHSHHFVFCPPGNGEDTHRMWEALYCGAVPVVQNLPSMRGFSDLPILLVDDLTTLTPQFLKNCIGTRTACSREKLELDFWRSAFGAAQKAAEAAGPLTLREWLGGWWREIQRVRQAR